MSWIAIVLTNYFEKKYPELKEDLPKWAKNKFHIAFHIIYFSFLMLSRIYFGKLLLYNIFLIFIFVSFLFQFKNIIFNKFILFFNRGIFSHL